MGDVTVLRKSRMGTPGPHAWGKLGPGEPASLTAFLRKAELLSRSGTPSLSKNAHN
jgi:hypothetical protein